MTVHQFLSAFYTRLANILTTKGDILTFSTTEIRLPVGIDKQVLTVDSAQAAGIKWATSTAPFGLVIKSVDESITSSTTLQDDNELLIALLANKRYFFILSIYVVSNTTPKFKFAITVPSGTTNARINNVLDGGVTARGTAAIDATTSIGLSGTSQKGIICQGYVLTDSTAGNLTLQFAQTVSDAEATTVKAGSTLLIWEV